MKGMLIHFKIAKIKVFSALVALGWHFVSKNRNRNNVNICDLRLTELTNTVPVLSPSTLAELETVRIRGTHAQFEKMFYFAMV